MAATPSYLTLYEKAIERRKALRKKQMPPKQGNKKPAGVTDTELSIRHLAELALIFARQADRIQSTDKSPGAIKAEVF